LTDALGKLPVKAIKTSHFRFPAWFTIRSSSSRFLSTDAKTLSASLIRQSTRRRFVCTDATRTVAPVVDVELLRSCRMSAARTAAASHVVMMTAINAISNPGRKAVVYMTNLQAWAPGRVTHS
jgi:hypothetical protein